LRFDGHVYKEGSHWLAEIPILQAMSQGKTKREALAMIGDWVTTMVDRPSFSVTVHPGPRGHFEIESSDAAAMTALLLQRKRESSGLSLADVARRLNARSRNAYARYERGDAVPSVDKLDELLRAVSPNGDFVIRDSRD
jgi:hypothetical protein